MKKLAIVLLAVVTALSTLAFVACGEKTEMTEVTYLSGMPASVTVGETPDYSALRITAKYNNGKTEEVAYNATDFTVAFDNTKVAENVEVTITYKGLTCKTSINVVAPVEVDSIEYKSGLAEEVYQNNTPDYSQLKILVKYSDGTEKEVAYNATDFTVAFDNTKVAENVEVTITYKGKTCKTTINVKLYAEISGVELPAFASAYYAAIGSQSGFNDKTQAYIVGNANSFYFVPVISAYDADDDLISDFKTSFFADVQLMNGENPTEIENAADYYTYDGETGAFNFTALANDKSFLIKTYPDGLSARQLENLDNYSVEFTVTVKDGYYNVYNAYDLFAMENRYESGNNERESKPAYDFKRAHGVTVDCNALKGLALQTNITMSVDTFPAAYFWSAEEVGSRTDLIGSLKDSTYMIYRNLGNNGTFAFEGNYFNINAKSLPMVLQEGSNLGNKKNPDEIVAHSKLFYVLGNSQRNGTTNTEYFVMKNVYSEGNLNRQESEQSGGLIWLEENGAKVDLYNCIATQWYITAFSSTTSDEHFLTVEKCIFKDDYNCIFYIWGGIIDVKETIAQGAGGPVFIADHARFDSASDGRNGSDGWTSDIRVDEYSAENMYSYVTGEEGWFKQMYAQSYASQIKQMDSLFSLNGAGKRSFIKNENGKQLMNVIAIFKAGGVESATGLFENATKGKGTFGKNQFNMENAFLNVPLASMGAGVTVGNSGMPVFFGSTADSVFGYTNQMANGLPVLVTTSGMVNDAASILAMPIQQEDSGFLNALIGMPGKAGRFGLVLGNFHAI